MSFIVRLQVQAPNTKELAMLQTRSERKTVMAKSLQRFAVQRLENHGRVLFEVDNDD